MTAPASRVLGPRLGIALGPDRLWAVRRSRVTSRPVRGEELRVRALTPMGTGPTWPELAAVLGELGAEMGSGGALAISLLPPLAQLRRIDLPPIDDDEARDVLARGAARYFVGVREPQAVSVSRILRGWRRTGSVIAAATPSRVVNAIVAAAEEAGWRVASIAPAHAAWVVAAQTDVPQLARKSAQLVVLRDEGTDLIRIDGGSISAVRYFAQAGEWIEQLADALVEPGDGVGPLPALAAGGGPRREQLVAVLRARGIPVASGGSSQGAIEDEPEATAAAYALAARRFDLLPPQVHLARQRTARSMVAIVAGVAAAALVVAAWAQLWGAQRELAAVRAERERIKREIGQVIEARRVIDDIERRLGALAPFETRATRWSTVIGQLAVYLPRDAHLLSLSGTADTVVVEGIALQAPGVVRAVRRAPGIASAVATEIRRDMAESGTAIDRFTLVAELAARDSSAAPRPAPRSAPRSTPRGAGRGGTP